MSNTDAFLKTVQSSIPNGIDLIQKFFFTFSRFECALKNTPDYLMGNNDAKPNWNKFASDISAKFSVKASKDIREAVEYIINKPPRKQINNDGVLVWKSLVLDENTPLANKLCLYIRTVRNNLMHGGKFNGNYNPETRNFNLISYSIILLDYFLELNEKVKANFLKDIE